MGDVFLYVRTTYLYFIHCQSPVSYIHSCSIKFNSIQKLDLKMVTQ